MVEGESRVTVTLPRALQEYAKGSASIEVRGATLSDVVARLNAMFPGLAYRLLDDQGKLRRFVLVFVNDDSVAHLPPEAVQLREGDKVHILPSVAGG